jgi:NitT/TauT family transport system substrate-binding protein
VLRRRTCALASALMITVVLAACGSDGGGSGDGGQAGGEELTQVTFAQPLPESVIFYPAIVGRDLGYFEEEGIEIEIISGGDEIPLQAFVENGDSEFAAPGASEVLFGAAQGATYDVVFDSWTLAAEGIVVPIDSDISSLDQLEGETVALATDEDRAFFSSALGAVGLSLQDVETTIVGRTSAAVIARNLTDGTFAAYSGAVSDFAALQANGIELTNITPEELGRTPAGSIIVSQQYIDENRDIVEGFLRAYAKATYVGVVNPEAVAEISRAAVPEEWADEEVAEQLTDVVIDAHAPDDDALIGELRMDVWETAQQQLIDAGELEEPVDLNELLNPEFLEAANDWDRSEVEQEAEEWQP